MAPLVALMVVIEPSACLTVPPGTSMNIGDHHQHGSERDHDAGIAESRIRNATYHAAGQNKRGALIRLPFPWKKSLQDGPGRAPGYWLGSGCLRFACGFWPPCSRLTGTLLDRLSHRAPTMLPFMWQLDHRRLGPAIG
jgi:hypothetical protein